MTGFAYDHHGRRIEPQPGFIDELSSLIPATASRFLEWGAGCSTLLFQKIASERGGSALTVEHDPAWYESVRKSIWYPQSVIALADLDGPRLSQSDAGLHYASYPTTRHGVPFDFILIDGRRRVECAINALSFAGPDTVIVLHDYRRTRYQALSHVFDFVDGPQFRKLVKRGKS